MADVVPGVARVAPSDLTPTDRIGRGVRVIAGGLAAVGLGAVLGIDSTLAFVVVSLVVLLALLNARPVTWVLLTIAAVWLSRVVTTAGIAPRFLDFIDFPLAVMSFLSAALSALATRQRVHPAVRSTGQALLVVSAVVAVSWAFSSPFEPQRLVAAWVLTFEPFLVLLAILLAPMTSREWKRLQIVVLALLVLQLLFSLGTIALGGSGDDVKGTLLGTGAGHHVSAGGLAIGFFLIVGMRARKPLWVLFGIPALLVMVVADAKQVLFLVPIALIVLAFGLRKRNSLSSSVASAIAGVIMAVVALGAILSYTASATAFDFIDRSVGESAGKVAVGPAIWKDISAAPDSLFFGLGPGESVSRFAFLTTPSYRRIGNPATLLGMHGSTGPDRYQDVARGGAYTGESSFTSAQSSLLGILGDYGLVGVLAFGLLIGAVLRQLRKVGPERQPLAAAAMASWALMLPLALIFDWLEQPPFTLTVIIITGLALRDSTTFDDVQQRQQSDIALFGNGGSNGSGSRPAPAQ